MRRTIQSLFPYRSWLSSSGCLRAALPSPGCWLLFRAFLQQLNLECQVKRENSPTYKFRFLRRWSGMVCTNSSNTFPIPLLDSIPRGASKAQERTISVGSVLPVGQLGCLCTSWHQCWNFPFLVWISSRPMHASERALLHLDVTGAQVNCLATQTSCKHSPHPASHQHHCWHWGNWRLHQIKSNQSLPSEGFQIRVRGREFRIPKWFLVNYLLRGRELPFVLNVSSHHYPTSASLPRYLEVRISPDIFR